MSFVTVNVSAARLGLPSVQAFADGRLDPAEAWKLARDLQAAADWASELESASAAPDSAGVPAAGEPGTGAAGASRPSPPPSG